MIKDVELAWLAGLWDGEGSITVFKHKEKNGTIKLCPTLLIVNCDEKIIWEAKRLLDELGTSFHIHLTESKNDRHKDRYQLNTRNCKYIKIVLEALAPYLIGKKAQAQLVLQFVDKRQDYNAPGGYRRRYDDEDHQLQEVIQGMNRKGKSPEPSTTKHQTLSSDDIVYSVTKVSV